MHRALRVIGVAIAVVATATLKPSGGVTRDGHAGLTPVCFGLAFWLMSIVVRTMPIAMAYSVWAGAASRA